MEGYLEILICAFLQFKAVTLESLIIIVFNIRVWGCHRLNHFHRAGLGLGLLALHCDSLPEQEYWKSAEWWASPIILFILNSRSEAHEGLISLDESPLHAKAANFCRRGCVPDQVASAPNEPDVRLESHNAALPHHSEAFLGTSHEWSWDLQRGLHPSCDLSYGAIHGLFRQSTWPSVQCRMANDNNSHRKHLNQLLYRRLGSRSWFQERSNHCI